MQKYPHAHVELRSPRKCRVLQQHSTMSTPPIFNFTVSSTRRLPMILSYNQRMLYTSNPPVQKYFLATIVRCPHLKPPSPFLSVRVQRCLAAGDKVRGSCTKATVGEAEEQDIDEMLSSYCRALQSADQVGSLVCGKPSYNTMR